MKKILSVFIKLMVITLSLLFNVLLNIMREYLSVSYDLQTAYLVNSSAVAILAILFALTFRFKVSGKAATISTTALIIAGLAATYLLIPYIGISYFTIFVCIAYATELIVSKLPTKQKKSQ